MRLSESARWLKVLWRTVKSAYPGSLFLLYGLLILSLAAGRAIASDLEEALRLFLGGASALGMFISVVGIARKSRALEILGVTLVIVNSTAALYIRFGVLGLAVPLALFAAMALVRYTLLARRKLP